MSASSLVAFAAALIVVAGSPGPSIAALVSRVLHTGLRQVVPFLAAMWFGELVWLAVAATGLAALAQTFSVVFIIVKWLGVAYLLYLAWQMWNGTAEAPGSPIPNSNNHFRMFATGLTLTLGNPKIVLFYVAILPTVVNIERTTWWGWICVAVVLVCVLASIDLTWSLAASRARRLLRSDRAIRIANRIGASMMVGAATAVAAR
ncbi:LysE family translocator [Mycolicibacterium sp. CBM1]